MQNQTNEEIKDISSQAVTPQANPLEYNDIFYSLEQQIGADVGHVMNLVQQGILTQQQGQYLLAQLSDKVKQISTYKNSLQPSEKDNTAEEEVHLSPMELFNREKPDFFSQNGREDVLNYIKGLDMDKDEILRIAQLVEGLEASAVDNYLKKAAYEKSLNDENSLAKSRLTSYAQTAAPNNKTDRIFTRKQIGAMSGNEFAENEAAIMDQLRHGLIR